MVPDIYYTIEGRRCARSLSAGEWDQLGDIFETLKMAKIRLKDIKLGGWNNYDKFRLVKYKKIKEILC